MEQQHDIDGLVAGMLAADTGHAFRRARRDLDRLDAAVVVQALVRAMRRATNQKVFDRAAKLLAEYGSEAAVEALAMEARTQRQYPRLAIRAFALCRHSSVAPVLLDLLEFGRMKQRRAAAFALARVRSPFAIEPLCRAAAGGDRGIGPEATEALRTFGGPRHVARLALSEPVFLVADHVRVLHAIGASPLREGFWRPAPFDPKRFLERESQLASSPVQRQAAAAAEFLRLQSTLLRGVEAAQPDTLLRAAATPGIHGPESLLRSADLETGIIPRRKHAAIRLWVRWIVTVQGVLWRVLGRD